MDAIGAFAASGSVSAFLFGALAFVCARDVFGSRARARRLQNQVGAGALQRATSRGVPALVHIARLALRFPFVARYAQLVRRALALKSMDATQESVVSLTAGACLCLIGIGAVAGHLVLGVGASCAFVLLAKGRSSRALETRREKLRCALPDALQAMGSCFAAGYTLVQTFSHLKGEVGGALGDLFGSAADAMRAGATPDQTLSRIVRESNVSELSFVAVALAVQHQTGGSMQRVLDATRESLAEELELRRSLRVQTAQAQLSARVVVGVSVGLVVVMLVLSPSFLQPFFSSAAGVVMLGLAVAMQFAGIVCIRHMLSMEVV